MRLDIVTIFPGFFAGIFEHGIVRRAQSEGLVTIGIHDLRNFTHDPHRTVDDRPFGGGEGMVLKPEPLAEALASLGIKPKLEREPAPDEILKGRGLSGAEKAHEIPGISEDAEKGQIAGDFQGEAQQGLKPTPIQWLCGTTEVVPLLENPPNSSFSAARTAPEAACVILLSAQGRPFKQSLARELAHLDRIVLLCGRYEGVDERINELFCDLELSIGDYVLSGGELAAAVVADAVIRLVPGVLGNQASGQFESFGIADAEIPADDELVPRSQHGSGGLLDYPHYTRPAEFLGLRAPEILLSGDHQAIRLWRREQQLRKTLRNRPDLLSEASLSAEDLLLLESIGGESGH